jgi:hypothetical protein
LFLLSVAIVDMEESSLGEEDEDEEDSEEEEAINHAEMQSVIYNTEPKPIPFAPYPPLLMSSNQLHQSIIARQPSPVSASAAREAGLAVLARVNAVEASRVDNDDEYSVLTELTMEMHVDDSVGVFKRTHVEAAATDRQTLRAFQQQDP